MDFEWDEAKNRSNQKKHGVSFEEASVVFEGDCYEEPDWEHSHSEERMLSIGAVPSGSILYVVWTERLANTIRIIGARRATPRETERYFFYRTDQLND